MHVTYVALHEVIWCMVVWCTLNLRRDGSSFMWHQSCQRCKNTTSVDIEKRAIKSYSLIITESHTSAVSLLESGEQRCMKTINNSSNVYKVQELCESRGGRPELPVAAQIVPIVSVDVKQH